MKRSIALFLLLVSGFLAACTPPTQPIAARSLQVAASQEDSIVADFANMAYQAALDKAAARLTASTQPAADVVAHAVQDCERVGNLRVQHERAQQLVGVAKLHIASEQGILNIIFGELSEANAAAKADGK